MEGFLDSLKYDANGLIGAIIRDAGNGETLMFAYMNRESLQRTIESGYCVYWSRSRQQFWLKGETSGHLQKVIRMWVDCDLDCLLIEVEQTGAACHTGFRSCFHREINLQTLTFETRGEPIAEPN